jgi:hypothetical protein
MPSLVWNTHNQPRRIFGWRDILSNWAYTQQTPSYVQSVLNNLQLVVIRANSYPLSHFTDFLNHEQEGIAWFLYEVITYRSIEGTIELAYVKGLLDLIDDLDVPFPLFLNSPEGSIRHFVEDNLSNEELEYVDMVPPLIPIPHSAYTNLPPPAFPVHRTAPAPAPPAASPAPPAPASTVRLSHTAPVFTPAATKKSSPYPMKIRVLRKSYNHDMNMDDVISLQEKGKGLYDLKYYDQESKVYTKVNNMSGTEVMKYLSNTLRLLTLDKDPFDKLQLIMPNSPSVMLNIDDLTSQTRDLIYDSVEVMMDNWPVKV